MRRTALLYVGPAVLVATGWLALEEARWPHGSPVLLILLAVLPALVRPRWGRVLAVAAVTPVALGNAFGVSPLDARPFDGGHDYFGPVLSGIGNGLLTFYDVTLPFDAPDQPLMHGALLAAIFSFCLVIALAVAARRPLLASVALVAGAAWPATLVAAENELQRGAFILAAVLALLAAGGRRPTRALRPALLAGAVLVAAALGAGAQPAVAKGEFLGWKGWDFYDRPADPVGVDFVWDASYDGITFPKEETTVLTVTGPRRGQYWRSSTLDVFEGDRWIEELATIQVGSEPVQLTSDPMLPAPARDPDNWLQAEVRIEALRDDHLVGPSVPVAYDPNGIGAVAYMGGGVAVVRGGLERDDKYVVAAYAPRPRPEQLAAVKPSARGLRNTVESRYLEVARGAPTLPFGAEDRDERIANLAAGQPQISAHLPLYQAARQVVGQPGNQYAAVVALETWFRSQGGFTYDEQPPVEPGAPPLVQFVTGHKRGYCQYFAGAMTLMLRYLGIPSRVAVGFTSGTYDADDRRWTVTDHDAHAWVEVWFDGWGWLPFDPTPTRGVLSGPYSGATALGLSSAIQDILRQEARTNQDSFLGRFAEGAEGSPLARDVPADLPGGGGSLAPRGESLLRLLGLVGAVLLVAIALAKTARRGARYLTRDPRKIAAACRGELVDYLLDQGVSISRSATALELGRALEERVYVDAQPFVRALSAARFAPPAESLAAARLARRELRALRKSIRAHLRAWERARGLVSVRSLGFGAPA